jgi:hypothetical protein
VFACSPFYEIARVSIDVFFDVLVSKKILNLKFLYKIIACAIGRFARI